VLVTAMVLCVCVCWSLLWCCVCVLVTAMVLCVCVVVHSFMPASSVAAAVAHALKSPCYRQYRGTCVV
jgi:hypothetical protein